MKLQKCDLHDRNLRGASCSCVRTSNQQALPPNGPSLLERLAWQADAKGVLICREAADEIKKLLSAVETSGVTNEQAFAAAAVTALRGHRWCGDQYPEDGWPDVNTALALYAKLGRSPEKEPTPVHGNDGAPCSCKGHPFNCYDHPTKCGCSAVEPTYNPETVAAIKAAQASGGKAVCCQQFPDCECEPEKASDE